MKLKLVSPSSVMDSRVSRLVTLVKPYLPERWGRDASTCVVVTRERTGAFTVI